MGRTGYSGQELFQLHTEILVALDTEAPRGVQLAMWDDYIAAFINGDMRHEDFFEEWNIAPQDFNWGLWREAMGYGNRR
jgi:hypothetical protein